MQMLMFNQFIIITIIIRIIIIFIRSKTIQKAVIENCGQDKSGNRNRHKSIKTIKHKNN